jgi:hypothetical protein
MPREPHDPLPDNAFNTVSAPHRPRTESAPISALPRSPFNGNAVAGGANPFDTWHVTPTPEQSGRMAAVVEGARFMANVLLHQAPASPERTLAMRALMECVQQAEYAITHSEAR